MPSGYPSAADQKKVGQGNSVFSQVHNDFQGADRDYAAFRLACSWRPSLISNRRALCSTRLGAGIVISKTPLLNVAAA